ncbi:uncharacterized protein LOC126828092 [Patella vulgata]|uniref:uncharacterized protein LOC126828092 n=1 Tax=Patella vulgata TaxID=6465 RepID=UPI0024A8E893|nr:uncharacterized protein LOC126828092 [Patella vulgata]
MSGYGSGGYGGGFGLGGYGGGYGKGGYGKGGYGKGGYGKGGYGKGYGKGVYGSGGFGAGGYGGYYGTILGGSGGYSPFVGGGYGQSPFISGPMNGVYGQNPFLSANYGQSPFLGKGQSTSYYPQTPVFNQAQTFKPLFKGSKGNKGVYAGGLLSNLMGGQGMMGQQGYGHGMMGQQGYGHGMMGQQGYGHGVMMGQPQMMGQGMTGQMGGSMMVPYPIGGMMHSTTMSPSSATPSLADLPNIVIIASMLPPFIPPMVDSPFLEEDPFCTDGCRSLLTRNKDANSNTSKTARDFFLMNSLLGHGMSGLTSGLVPPFSNGATSASTSQGTCAVVKSSGTVTIPVTAAATQSIDNSKCRDIQILLNGYLTKLLETFGGSDSSSALGCTIAVPNLDIAC